VCLGPLCEPVAWPGCSHCYCLVCTLRTRHRPKPVCPLCRAPAPRTHGAAELQVDAAHAARLRRVAGYSRYEAQRREVWAEAAAVDLQAVPAKLPLFQAGPRSFPAGSRQKLWLLEPRYRLMLRRALAPGGEQRFAVVLRPAEFAVGARGRVCEILEGGEDANGDMYVSVEGGAACRVVDVATEEVQPSGAAPLFHGELEEVDEEEMESGGHEPPNPFAAVSEMVGILTTLGRHLRAVRRHRAMVFEGHGGTESLLDRELLGLEQRVFEESNLGPMLNLLAAYQQIIGQMDRVLAEASSTAEQLSSLAGPAGGAPPNARLHTAAPRVEAAAVPRLLVQHGQYGGTQHFNVAQSRSARATAPAALAPRRRPTTSSILASSMMRERASAMQVAASRSAPRRAATANGSETSSSLFDRTPTSTSQRRLFRRGSSRS